MPAVPHHPPARYKRIDAVRGFAIVWMAIFHFCFDLDYFGLIDQDFYRDPFWTWQRTAIVSLFLGSAGVALAVAAAQQQSWRRFWRRWLQVAGGAVLVSVGSYAMFPASFIFFGVLHGIAVMLVISRLVACAPAGIRTDQPFGGSRHVDTSFFGRPGGARWYTLGLAGASRGHAGTPFVRPGRSAQAVWWWIGGAVLIVLPWLVSDPFFDSRWTAWVGLHTRKPVTEDFVPLLPWMGVMWWGVAAGHWLFVRRPQWLAGRLPQRGLPAFELLAWLGRHSLSFYLLHQPVLIGALLGLRAIGLV